MIVSMKKVTIVCLSDDRTSTLETLRALGILHLAHLQEPAGHDIDQARKSFHEAQSALTMLDAYKSEKESANEPAAMSAPAQVARALEIAGQRKHLLDEIDELKDELAELTPFGDFDPDLARQLAARGIRTKLCHMLSNAPVSANNGVSLHILSKDRSGIFAAAIGVGDFTCPGREIPMPARRLSAIKSDLDIANEELVRLDEQLAALALHHKNINRYVDEQYRCILFAEAQAGMAGKGRLVWLRGFCPVDTASSLQVTARAAGWALQIEDPGDEDPVPTLVRNPVWIRPIRLLLQMIGISPGYNEVDISFVFLLFYSLFFAMLVGDAGYGAIFLLITLGIRFGWRKAPPELPRLLGLLSITTIAWGILTGSYFGIRFESLPAPLAAARVTWLTSEQNLMQLCFLIGAIQLSIAHLWNIARCINRLTALAQVGWVGMTWVMYFMANFMILDNPLPGFAIPVFIASLILILLFMTPLKQMKTEWYNHIMLPLSVISNFGDVVSYVRLFAVGSAGAAISMAFNEIAIGSGINSITSGLIAALILFLAHTMNITLCALGVIVHGVRLNTLEFSGHLGMQWTGVPYQPFSREQEKN